MLIIYWAWNTKSEADLVLPKNGILSHEGGVHGDVVIWQERESLGILEIFSKWTHVGTSNLVFFFFFNFYFLIWHGGTVDSWYDKKNHFLLLHLTHQIFLSNEITTMTKLTQYWKVKNQIDTIEMLETKLKIDVEVRD